MQDVVNDPVQLLQAVIEKQVADGHSFEGVALNIATQPSVTFLTQPNDPTGPAQPVPVTDGAGGIENILFLLGEEPPVPGQPGPTRRPRWSTRRSGSSGSGTRAGKHSCSCSTHR